MNRKELNSHRILFLIMTLSIIIIGVLCALVYFNLQRANSSSQQAQSVPNGQTTAGVQSVDPIQFMTKVKEALPQSKDVNVINQDMMQMYPTDQPQMSLLASTLQYNQELNHGLQQVETAFRTQYTDALNHVPATRVQNDYQHLQNLVQNYLLLLQTQVESP